MKLKTCLYVCVLKACVRLPQLFETFRSETDLINLKHLAYVAIIGMNMYGGYPEIYEPIVDYTDVLIVLIIITLFSIIILIFLLFKLKPYANESQSQDELDDLKVKFLLQNTTNEYKNINNQKLYGYNHHHHQQQKNDQQTRKMDIDDSSSSYDDYVMLNRVKAREHLTGLINMGNTCYLNCILQALYACKK